MDNPSHMNKWFPFLQCIVTIALAPLIWTLFYLDNSDSAEIIDLYPIIVVFGFLFATPFLAVYYILMILLSRYTASSLTLRLYSIVLPLVGIYITINFILDEHDTAMLISYFLAAAISGFLFRLRASNEIPPSPTEEMRTLFLLSLLAFVLAAAAQVLGYFRTSLLGIPPGVGGHNASFNIVFYFPAMVLSGVIAYFTAGHVILGWKEFRNIKLKILSLLLTIPTLALILYYIFNAFRYK